MNGLKIKTIALIIFLSMFLQFHPSHVNHVHAGGIPVIDGTNFATRMLEYITQLWEKYYEELIKTATQLTSRSTNKMNWNDGLDRTILRKLKTTFVKWLNKTIQDEYKTGNRGDKPYFVTDWQEYLYKAPQDFAEGYIKNEFIKNKLSNNLCGSGQAGSQYYEYMCERAAEAIETRTLRTDLQSDTYFVDPDNANPEGNLFSDGNLKAFAGFFECANNPYCAARETEELFDKIIESEKEVAEKKASGEGALPMENDDRTIAVPSKIFESSMNEAIKSGNEMILNTDNWQEIVLAMATEEVYKIMDTTLNTAMYPGDGNSTSFNDYVNKYIKDNFYERLR